MQFLVKDLQQGENTQIQTKIQLKKRKDKYTFADILCLTVFDRDFFSPNEFLGRSELRVADIIAGCEERRGPVIIRQKTK